MPRLQFGYTWWGKKWLDALIATDYSNRLPRGMRYARNGSVRSMTIAKGDICAAVQGSRPSPYSVKIHIPPFKKEQKEAILSLIAKHPFILSQLSHKKLPAELYEEFKKKHLHLFPQKWSELKANCSCPDWADCCKHIAAVIYLIANKIDLDPFLIFSLRDFDLLATLPKRDGGNADLRVTIQTAGNIIAAAAGKKMERSPLSAIDLLQSLDFSRVPDLGKEIVSILPENQIFCRCENVKGIFSTMYTNLMRGEHRIAMEEEKKECDAFRLTELSFSEDLRVESIILKNETKMRMLEKEENTKELALFLRSIPFVELLYCEEGVRALALAERCASTLCKKGAIVPELLELSPSRFRIRFVPLFAHPEVRSLVASIVPAMPFGTIAASGKNQRSAIHTLPQEETLVALLSFFIQRNVEEACDSISLPEDSILRMLFLGEDLVLSKEITRDIPELVWLYFSRFFLARSANAPILMLHEQKHGGFDLVLGMRRKADEPEAIPLSEILKKKQYVSHRQDLLRIFGLLAEHYSPISTALMSPTASIELSDDQCIDMLQKILPVLTLLGIRTQLPKSLRNLATPQATLDIRKRAADKIASYLQLQDLLRFEWRIAIGDRIITEQELQTMLQTGKKLVKFRDTYVLLDPDRMRALLETMRRPPAMDSAAHMLHALLTREFRGAPMSIDPAVIAEIEALFKDKPVPLPGKLLATLRPYQERGFAWLYRNMRIGFGSLLADDMGLGKTIQVITLLLKMKEEKTLLPGAALVVAPTTLLTNWQKEIQKFAPSLRVAIYHGQDRKLPEEAFDVLLTSYGLVRRDAGHFQDILWSVTVLDEAQNVKNRNTAQSKAVKGLKSRFCIAMTGTPVENSLMEYWNIADSIQPGYLGEAKTFKTLFASPIEKERDGRALGAFHAITKPLIIRRLKTDTSIITDLPRKVENDAYTSLTNEQAALYQSVVDSVMYDIEHSEGIERKGLIFKLMTALKQICNHPAHYQKSSAFGSAESGKMQYLLPLLDTLREGHEKALIFTQYTEMGRILLQLIKEHAGREPLFFHGGLSRKDRDSSIDAFQSEPHHDIMILSLKAGGVGLNLTAASQVIHYDLWWNPAVETQATDRAYRIGQKKNVLVHRFITQGTFEEKIDAMIKRKKELANLAVASGEKWLGELSNKELRDIVTLAR
ncbi:hypothetical protein A2880_03280 [Candidatus Peribacteria bacterium RIFCSPHIGHO2_01_FULL_49_38]|nr:MAG: hypothetical protein A2880_03280 [Candidatus Peribacteria bacterium RIFCSPHIGHO2_01_FULL_49_38]